MSSLISNLSKKSKMNQDMSDESKPKASIPFKQQFEFSKRKEEAMRIRAKYPDRIPVIAERAENSTLPNIDKKKYLVPADLTFSQFIYVIRKRIKLAADEALFLFVNNTIPAASALMSDIYKEHRDGDLFLYVIFREEGVFGG
jgi:GABA(A) receptor-associated protein